jgi:hypothetical protein
MSGKPPIANSAKPSRVLRTVRWALVCLAAYLGSYLALSVSGAYVPGTWGLRGVKNWLWAPALFADQKGAFRDPIQFAFLPAWLLDRWFWHDDRTGESGPRHPAFANEL